MTNLQQARVAGDGGLAPETLKRLWFWSPIVAGGALALLLLLGLALPQWLQISEVQKRVQELEQYRQEVELLRLQALKTQRDRQEAQRQQEQLIRLVTGRGDVATFLATLDLEAVATGVMLQLYEPTPPLPPGAPGGPPAQPAPPPPPAQGQPAPPPPKPAEVDVMRLAGLREHPLLMSAHGTYPQLLAFLRRMELLEVLVEQKNLTLSVVEGEATTKSGLPLRTPKVEVKLGLTLWSKEPKPPANGPAKTAPAQPPAAQPPG